MFETERAMEPKARIDDEPIMVTDTGLTCFGKRIFIEGDEADAKRLADQIENNYPLIASRTTQTT